ncbi:MAG: DNA internalization-related competence protein ComEC/Rec2 [Lachnospiraceae bacterium]|nr:DNA internalization-related competence protein ComEC/Rec2 [Lachnospiraceae bacterium]
MRRPLLFGCVCVVAVIYLYMCMFNPPPWDASGLPAEEEYVTVTGQIYKKESRESYGKKQIIYYLQDISFHGLDEEPLSPKKIRCELQQNTDIPLGTKVIVQGCFRSYQQATNPGEFDAATYYGVQNIVGRITGAEVTHVGQDYWRLREALYELKELFASRLVNGFGEEDGGILVKMLLGDGSLLDSEIKTLYQENGIVHILSISGMHISMLGMGVYSLLRRCHSGIYVSAIIGAVFILLYGTMIGFDLSATRAIGMYLLHMIAVIWGKSYDMLTAMGVILLTMVLENPKVLFHSGFLLSFGSVCALGLLLPKLQEYIPHFSSLIVSLSVTIFTLPIQFYYFYKIPLYSAFLNLLILPFLGIVMVIGIIVMTLPMLHRISLIGSLVLRWYELLCHLFELLPVDTLYVGCPAVWKVVIYYAGLFAFICYKSPQKKKWLLIVPTLLIVFLCVQIRPPLRIVMMDVGQGDGILLQTGNRSVLVDGGSSSKSDVGKYQIAPCLAYYGVDYLDAVIITHPDGDHMNGLVGLLENGYGERIGQILLPAIDEGMREKEFADIYELLEPYGIPVSYMSAGDAVLLGDVRMECLHPEEGADIMDSNAYSQVYYLTYSEFSMLLTGDVEAEGEELLLEELSRRGICDVTMLKVAHHGSRYSTGEEFLEQVSPEIALISCGADNSYGHPHEETLERLETVGSRILTTPEYGAIVIEVGEEVRVQCWKTQ